MRRGTFWIIQVASMLALLALFGCELTQNPGNTGNPPSSGNGGLVDTTYPKAVSQPIVWAKATDDKDPQSELEYKLVRSDDPDISTVADMETAGHGTALMSWTKDVDTFPDSGLTGGTDYYYNVLVRDTEMNIGAYTMKLLRTPIPETEVFIFSPGETLDGDNGFTGVSLIEPITDPDGYIQTTTDGLVQDNTYTSSFTTPLFSDMDRNDGNGFAIEWKVKFLAFRDTPGYTNKNQIYVKLLDRFDTVLYTVLEMPLTASNPSDGNRALYKGTSVDLTSDYWEGFVYPTGLNTPKWISYRFELTSAGLSVYNDLTANETTSDPLEPDWGSIPAEMTHTDTENNHIAKIQLEYVHFGDYSILVKDFSIIALP